MMNGTLDLLALLDRPALDIPDLFLHQELKRVVVTGAGGSIGSAIARKLSPQVEFLGLIGHSEGPIFNIANELRDNPESCPISARIVSVGDHPERWIEDWEPDLIIHAAAFKHVGLMQSQPESAFVNNTVFSVNLAGAAHQLGVRRFTFISTDKAACPTTIMGASKRLAEGALLSRPPYANICRFGNVIGSSGSVVEIFAKRIAQDQPIKLNSPNMKRFFITPDEAAGLVLATCGSPGLHTLNMGEQVLISDIAQRIGEQLGKTPIIEEGTPVGGEKEDEEILNPGEHTVPFGFQDVVRHVLRDKPYDPYHVRRVINQVANGGIDIVKAANLL
jgi:FlaA1/EpsC-like NDP-sugar epimerase